MSQTGRPAELVRKKGDKSIPIGTDNPKQTIRISTHSRDGSSSTSKRPSSDQFMEDSVHRSMARRRKLAPGETLSDPIPQVCADCGKEFKRPCDLTYVLSRL